MNAEHIVEQFERDGYVMVEDFFDRGLMDALDFRIRDHFGFDPEAFHNSEFLSKAKTEVIPWFPKQTGDDSFDALEADEGLRRLTTRLLGRGWTTHYSMVMFSRCGSSGQAWHQDCPPDDPARFNVNRLVYTRDINALVGGQVVVVPGSHKSGLLPAGDPNETLDDQVVLTPGKGTLILLHGHTWHRVLRVRGAYRYSINMRCAAAGVPADVTDICVYRNMRYQFSTERVIEERGTGGNAR